MLSFPNVLQLDKRNRGKWHDAFGNRNPITLELGCGKGEYTVGLAGAYPQRNFIGVDIKGARIYTGARQALEQNLSNVLFLRTQVDHLAEYFERGEADEIWITFADPHPPAGRARRRLTSPKHLDIFRNVLKPGGTVHLKTDSDILFRYTLDVIDEQKLTLLHRLDDVHHTDHGDPQLNILTYYERMHLAAGKRIRYLRFALP